jgi:hypothetical protein
MFDYNFMMVSRGEYEEKIRKIEQQLAAERMHGKQPGMLSQLAFSLGARLESTGAWLKARVQPTPAYQPAPVQQTYRRNGAR